MTEPYYDDVKISNTDKTVAALCPVCNGIEQAYVSTYIRHEDELDLKALQARGYQVKEFTPKGADYIESCYCAGWEKYTVSKGEVQRMRNLFARTPKPIRNVHRLKLGLKR
ncbi:hypothetical protein ACYPKM_04165 [Pseudomonas aeruginosa]